MKLGYSIEVVEPHSLPIVPERKITNFFDHTMEKNSIDNEIVKSPKRPKRTKPVQIDVDKV